VEPGDYPLKLYRGDSYKWKFVVWADTDKTIPAQLQGVTPAAQIRDTAGGNLMMSLLCEIQDPNIVIVTLQASMWAPTAPKVAGWDLELTYPTTPPEVTTIIAGKVSITMDYTNTAPEAMQLRAVS
jgi:hypothetical protein